MSLKPRQASSPKCFPFWDKVECWGRFRGNRHPLGETPHGGMGRGDKERGPTHLEPKARGGSWEAQGSSSADGRRAQVCAELGTAGAAAALVPVAPIWVPSGAAQLISQGHERRQRSALQNAPC